MTTTTPCVLNATDQPQWRAVIDPDLCVGCTKCLRTCPTGAIHGMRKVVHTVDLDVCDGCQKCAEVCPVKCISYKDISNENNTVSVKDEVESESEKTSLPLPSFSAELEAKIAAARQKSKEKYAQKGTAVPKALRPSYMNEK